MRVISGCNAFYLQHEGQEACLGDGVDRYTCLLRVAEEDGIPTVPDLDDPQFCEDWTDELNWYPEETLEIYFPEEDE